MYIIKDSLFSGIIIYIDISIFILIYQYLSIIYISIFHGIS